MGKDCWAYLSRLEEREDLENDELERWDSRRTRKRNCRYYALPPDIASFSDDQIEAWAEKFYDQMAHDLKLWGFECQEEFSQQKE